MLSGTPPGKVMTISPSDCSTEKVCLAMVMVPLRDGPVLAATA